MRQLFFLGAILLSASLATAATVTNYAPTRDTFMRGGLTDLHGSDPNGRASKSFLDFYISDFDRVAIVNSIQGELGHSLTLEDMPNVAISLHLFSNDLQGYKPTALSRAAVFQGTQDWVEGTNDTLGATKGFAVYDPVNAANNRTWKNRSGSDVAEFLFIDKVENAVFEEWGGEPNTYRKWALDDEVAFAYLTDPLSLGLFLNASDQGNPDDIDAQYSNTEIYSREDTGDPSRMPFLEVEVVPEAGTVTMLGLGVFLLVQRRRRTSRNTLPTLSS